MAVAGLNFVCILVIGSSTGGFLYSGISVVLFYNLGVSGQYVVSVESLQKVSSSDLILMKAIKTLHPTKYIFASCQ